MRLKSPFKDYYDGVLRLDEEPEPLYLRYEKEEKLDTQARTPKVTAVGWVPTHYEGLAFRPFTIGFGPKTYRGLAARAPAEVDETFLYGLDDTWSFLRDHLGKTEVATLKKNPTSLGFGGNVRRYFHYDNTNRLSDGRQPIWLAERPRSLRPHVRFVENPRLGGYDFARILPPYEAYQTLRMFLSNQAAPREYIPPVSNEDMIAAKGFDAHSFRATKPGGPARKRRKNAK